MRGWQARTLGPGTSQIYASLFSIPSSVGSIKLEANAEYRFPIVWKLEGALFVDAGNIWDFPVTYIEYDDHGSELMFDKSTLEGIGLDWGAGLRLNLGLIVVRVDTGFRIHDPSKDAGMRWIDPGNWFRDAYAVHFGVGYPF